jgi:hypothetical protein
MTADEIKAESASLKAAIAQRVAERDVLLQSISVHSSSNSKRRVRDGCRELRALNRVDQKRLATLAILERGGSDVAA